MRIASVPGLPERIDRPSIRQRRKHKIKESDGSETIGTIEKELAASDSTKVKEPRRDRGRSTKEAYHQQAAGDKKQPPGY